MQEFVVPRSMPRMRLMPLVKQCACPRNGIPLLTLKLDIRNITTRLPGAREITGFHVILSHFAPALGQGWHTAGFHGREAGRDRGFLIQSLKTVRSAPYIDLMEVEIQVPEEVPVMTLPNVAFFPQALLPLRIFEPRYRRMLRDVLATNRMFAVACLDPEAVADGRPVRAAAPGGLHRPRPGLPEERGRDLPRASSRGSAGSRSSRSSATSPTGGSGSGALESSPGAEPGENAKLQSELSRLIRLQAQARARRHGGHGRRCSAAVDDPEIFADIAAFNLCAGGPLKQKLLETLDVNRRLALLLKILRSEVDTAVLHLKLRGGPPDDRISMN